MADAPNIIVGIDLGTTFSLVAYADEAGPHILRDENAEGRVPSVLRFAPDGRVTVGWDARAHAVEHPAETVYSIKRLMGIGVEQLKRELPYLSYRVGRKETDSAADQPPDAAARDVIAVQINGRWLTPQEISALVLRELKARAERHFGREIHRAVITVPAYFDDSQRQATRDAGRIAGLEVVRIINEPTAAALAYGLGVAGKAPQPPRVGLPIGDKSKCTGTSTDQPAAPALTAAPADADAVSHIAVYDLGGGTFDVSILRLESGVVEVLGTHGNTHLGGDDFDRAIMTLVQTEVREQFNLDIDSPRTRQSLRLLAEQVKIRLSSEASARLELDLGRDRTYRREISRDEFEQLIEPFIEETVIACCRALANARIETGRIDRVVLVGGSSRIPLVRRRIEQFFGRPPYTALNPDEVVALGAAVQAQILSGGRRDLLLLDVTPLSLGIETMGGAMGKLIMANTRIPCRATEMFTTFVDGQTNVQIRVLQGERELAKDCRTLGEFVLGGIPPMPAGIPKIEVTFLIDANGILNVSALEQRSGQEASIQVIPAHGLTSAEVQRITAEGYRFAREDMTAHRLIDLRNQVEFDTAKTEQMLAKVGDQLPAAEREAIEEGLRVLRKLATSTGDPEKLHRALDEFDKQCVRLAETAVRETLKSL
ncbi:MAG: Hsp70 family protein [Phycisphaerae bacterium]|nr:Hsp70 family protein [Phycisphaerae bacterium]